MWAFLRGASGLGVAGGSDTFDGVVLDVALALLVDPIVVVIIFIDMTRRSELLFLANLGRSFRGLSVIIVAMCVLLEAALRVAVG